MSNTTLLNTGPGLIWTINAPTGVVVTPMKNGLPIQNPSTDASVVATSLKITVNYDYSDFTNPTTGSIETIDFIGPATTPPVSGTQFDGLRLPFELDITNQLGVPINGYSVYLANQNLLNKPAPPVPDVGSAHPNNYAHFHGVTTTTFVDAASGTANATPTLYGPNFVPAASGPAGAVPAPNFISVAGIIAAGATEKAAGLTLHSENFPDAAGGSFSLALFPQDTIGKPAAPSFAIAATDTFKPDGVSGTTPYTFTVTRTGDMSQPSAVSYSVAGSGSRPAQGYLFTNPSGSVNFAAGTSTATLIIGVSGAAIRSNEDFTVALSGPTFGPATAAGRIEVNTTGTPGPNDVALTGPHDQYFISDTDGQLHVQDKVAGRDDTRVVANPNEILFSDGVGLFDATGNAGAMTRLYQAAFGRAPDAPGLEYAVPLINQGSISLRQIADGFLDSGEYQRQYGNPDTPTFVQELYQNVLHRAVNPSDPLDVAGVQNFNNLANSQGRGAALLALSDSQENHRLTNGIAGDKTDAQAARIYQAAFNRGPDAPGLQAVTNALKGGASAELIAQGFVDSGEFQRAYGTQSNGDFVASLYRNVLHREADAGGKAQYTKALDAGFSRGFALASIADSGENRVNTATLTHDAWVFLK